jgi:hypothetical protein
MVATSLDGGQTFASPALVDPVYDICPRVVDESCSLYHTSFRVNSYPSIATDATTGQLYVTWGDYRNGDADIMLSRSDDGGRSWLGPFRVNGDATTNDQLFPWVAVDAAGTVYVAYYDRRDDPRNYLLHTYVSTSPRGAFHFDGGRRVTEQPINADVQFPTFFGDYIGIAASNQLSHPIWTDTRRGQQDIFTAAVEVDALLASSVRRR